MEEPKEPESHIIRMTGRTFIRLTFGRHAFAWIFTSALLLVTTTVLAFCSDLRWLIVALMLLFIVIPLATAFFYFNQGLREITVLNTLPHRLRFIERGIILTQYEEEEGIKSWMIPYSDLDRYFVGSDWVMVPMRERKRGFLWIPLDGFSEPECLNLAVKKLGVGIRNKGK